MPDLSLKPNNDWCDSRSTPGFCRVYVRRAALHLAQILEFGCWRKINETKHDGAYRENVKVASSELRTNKVATRPSGSERAILMELKATPQS